MKDYSALIGKIKKAVKKLENKTSASSVHVVGIDDNIEKLVGLVIIYTYSSPDIPTQSDQP